MLKDVDSSFSGSLTLMNKWIKSLKKLQCFFQVVSSMLMIKRSWENCWERRWLSSICFYHRDYETDMNCKQIIRKIWQREKNRGSLSVHNAFAYRCVDCKTLWCCQIKALMESWSLPVLPHPGTQTGLSCILFTWLHQKKEKSAEFEKGHREYTKGFIHHHKHPTHRVQHPSS